MLPFHFGPPDRRLFGTLTFPRTRSQSPTAVLLCNPFGQEAVRVHRLFRVLAERGARQGLEVLRFDYFGTGDSAGDDTDGDLDGWTGDVLAADDELRRRCNPGRVVWLGTRLGAAIAARATLSAERPPDLLVLWEPVLDGAAYLRLLAQSTVSFVQGSLTARDPRLDAQLARGAIELEREGVGFELGERLRGQLRAFHPEDLAVPRASRVSLIHTGDQKVVGEVLQRWRMGGGVVDETVHPVEFNGLTEEAWNTALVPAGILEMLGVILAEER